MKRSTPPDPAPDSRSLDQRPIDADWPAREQAAKDGQSDEEEDAYGDPKDVKDEGVLESLGKAVSSPVRDKPEEMELGRDGDAKKLTRP